MSTQRDIANSFSIKEVSKLTGLPASTLRYYESIGIIMPVERGTTSKHRLYSHADVNVLDTIACLNATGMKLEDMKTYIANTFDGEAHADDQMDLLRAQQARLDNEARHIEQRRQYVELKIRYWQAVKTHDSEQLQAISAAAKVLARELKKV